MNKKSFPTAFLFLLRGPGGPTRSELAKRLTELRLIFQPWRLQFACVFSRICVWVLFLTLLNPATNYCFLKKILCVRLSNLCFPCVSGLEEVKSVALRACWKLLEEEEGSIKSMFEALKQCEQDLITHPAPPHPTRTEERSSKSVLEAVWTRYYYPLRPTPQARKQSWRRSTSRQPPTRSEPAHRLTTNGEIIVILAKHFLAKPSFWCILFGQRIDWCCSSGLASFMLFG